MATTSTTKSTAVHDPYKNQPVLRGPFPLFDGSFTLEVLDVPSDLDASCLLRVTEIPTHPLLHPPHNPKSHPQVPPLHLHFSQAESFLVVQGEIGVEMGYDQQEKFVKAGDGVFTVEGWVPHRPFLVPSLSGAGREGKEGEGEVEEKTVVYMFATPGEVDGRMDGMFFEALLRGLDERWRVGKMPDLLEMMVIQHASQTALIMLPTWWVLGSLRWRVPYLLQMGLSAVGKMLGYEELPRRFFKE